MARDDYGRRLPMDTRMIREIADSPALSAENPHICSDWGGPEMYTYLAKQPQAIRMTYLAVQNGYSTVEDISAATDLPVKDVDKALSRLSTAGIVDPGVVER